MCFVANTTPAAFTFHDLFYVYLGCFGGKVRVNFRNLQGWKSETVIQFLLRDYTRGIKSAMLKCRSTDEDPNVCAINQELFTKTPTATFIFAVNNLACSVTYKKQ